MIPSLARALTLVTIVLIFGNGCEKTQPVPKHAATANPKKEAAPRWPKVAESLEEARDAVVMIVVPQGDGKAHAGTGFLVNERGWVATNSHVIDDLNDRAEVRLASGTLLEIGRVVSRSKQKDLAILELSDRSKEILRQHQVPILDTTFTDALVLGRQLFAFGHPKNLQFSLTQGIVSRLVNTHELLRDMNEPNFMWISPELDIDWIQYDGSVHPGNSGGPLMDPQGRVVGVITILHVPTGYSFATHVQYLRELMNDASKKPTGPSQSPITK